MAACNGVTPPGIRRICIGTGAQQRLDGGQLPAQRRQHQRRAPTGIARFNVSMPFK